MSEASRRLVIENVTKTYPGVTALDKINFDVIAGEVHGLVGENGAGKSTLMAVASGATAPDDGTVTINGQLLAANPEQARELGLAIVRQEPSLMPDLTVAENIFLGQAKSRRPSLMDINQWAGAQLKRWRPDISVNVRDRVQTLSPEVRFIIEIVKALAAEPKVLVLDEPTEHLVAEDVERLFELVRELASHGTAVVYISHRIREVQRICGRITVLRDGVSQGTFEGARLTEQDIVRLIVGRSIEREFPEKGIADTGSQPVLKVENFSGTGFQSLSVQLRKGEIIGLAGIEANGQRDFVRALAGLQESKGTLEINGKRVALRSSADGVRHGLRYLPGDRHKEGILGELTVRENFTLRSIDRDVRSGFISAASELDRTRDAIDRLAVKTPSTETPIASLSGGNQQKVVLSSVLASQPVVMLVDEPTQGVDIGTRAEIYNVLRKSAAEGVGVIVVSSDAAEIAGLCDRVLIFSRGQVVKELTGSDVSENGITAAILTATTVRRRQTSTVPAFFQWLAGDSAPLIMVAMTVFLLGAYATSVNEFYLTARNFTGMFALIATLAVVAYGQQVLMLIGGIDLSVGPLMGLIVVVASFFLTADTSISVKIAGWILMLTVAIAAGFANWALVDIAKLHPMIATLATYMSFQAISLTLRPTPDGLISYDVMDTIGVAAGPVPIVLLAAVVLAIGLEFALFRSQLGLSLRGLGSRLEAARVAGIAPRRVRAIAYVGCSLLAGLAALPMMTQVGSGDPTAGVSYTLTSIAAGVVGGARLFGGRGSFIGCLLGAALIVQINVVTAFLDFDAAAQNYLLGAMIILAVALYSKSRQVVAAA